MTFPQPEQQPQVEQPTQEQAPAVEVPQFTPPAPDIAQLQARLDYESRQRSQLQQGIADAARESARIQRDQAANEIRNGDIEKGLQQYQQLYDQQIGMRDQAIRHQVGQQQQINQHQMVENWVGEITRTFSLTPDEQQQVRRVDPNSMPVVAQLLYRQRKEAEQRQQQQSVDHVQQRIASGADAVGSSSGPIGGDIEQGSRAHLASLLGL